SAASPVSLLASTEFANAVLSRTSFVTGANDVTLTVPLCPAEGPTPVVVRLRRPITSQEIRLASEVPQRFTMLVSPASQTVEQGTSATYSVTTAASGSVGQILSLSVTGLPAGATGSFTPN